jgi:cobalamin biosynthesis protein CobD/CbiB
MAKKQVDAEQLVDNLQNAKFGLSIQNIVAIVTVLSSLIAGWYTFTGRIDSLEEVVVTALGIKRTARSVGYGITTLKANELNEVRATSSYIINRRLI